MTIFLQGLTMGLAYIAPIGMQNLFVINAALTYSRRRALLTAMIVLFFDITLSLSCFFGIGTLMYRYPWLQSIILGVGSIIVCSIGLQLLRAKGSTTTPQQTPRSLGKTISQACVVTWFNPQAIIDGTMLLGAIQVTLSTADHTPFMSGVIIASFFWFLTLTCCISLFSRHFNARVLRGINLLCGLVILGYGLKLIWEFFHLTGLL